MLDLRDLECLSALARHKHFARAAEACGMSQPAFSMRIRNLEDRLETQIVRRGNRFQGLTAEGEVVLSHGRAILDSTRALEEQVRAAKGEVIGRLRLGTIPTANTYAAQVAVWLSAAHPGIRLQIDNSNSLALLQGLEDGSFDAALTYTEGVATSLLHVEPLYQERYVLLLPTVLDERKGGEISWLDAAKYPLILLEKEMQNRRILDQIFSEVGAPTIVVAETDGFTAMVAMAVEGMGAAVLPHVLVERLGAFDGVSLLSLVEPVIEKSVGLVFPEKPQLTPAVQALRDTVRATHAR
ncbi:MAG: LysR family transcriptional regulator [Pseudomonadota bacterium]